MTQIIFFLLALIASTSVSAQSLDLFDQYGGAKALQCPTGPKPLFYVEKIDNRWWWCTPDGNAFWLHSIWAVLPPSSGRGHTKYGGGVSPDFSSSWYPVMNRRVSKWGFNAWDSYTSRRGSPTGNSHIQIGHTTALPIIMGEALRPSFYGLTNNRSHVSQPLKSIDTPLVWSTASASRTDAWRFQDVFDTNYKAYLLGMLNDTSDNGYNHVFTSSAAKRAYVMGWSVDDTDWLAGFGANQDFLTGDDGKLLTSGGRRHLHLGLGMLATAPTMGVLSRGPASGSGMLFADPRTTTITCTGAEEAGGHSLPGYTTGVMSQTTRPSDTVCTKLALRNFLAAKYGTIAALNSAWGSSYTTFDSTGTRVSNQLVTTTNGTDTLTFTVPGVRADSQISPFSMRIYKNGVYIGADARHLDQIVMACRNGASTTLTWGQLWGETLRGSISGPCTNPATTALSTINYTTGVVVLKFDTAFSLTNAIVDASGNAKLTFDAPAHRQVAAYESAVVGESVTISGATGSAAALNGTWIVTSKNASDNTVVIATTGVPANTYSSSVANANMTGNPPPAGQEIRLDYVREGWGRGTGLMDEDGRSKTWIPNFITAGTSQRLTAFDIDIKNDLDEFLYRYAYRYFKDMRDALDSKYAPLTGCDRSVNNGKGTCPVYTGPSYIGTWSNPGFAPIVKAAGDLVDVYPYYSWPEWMPDYEQRMTFIYENFGDKPIITWEAFTGGLDSPYPVDGSAQVRPKNNTQESRGEQYKSLMTAMQSYQYPNGSYPAIGVRFWSTNLSGGEQMNWGFITPNDDPIDGFCPGPGTREEVIPGGAPVTSVVVTSPATGPQAVVNTSPHHSMSVGVKVRLSGCTVDTNLCADDWTVRSVVSGNFTLQVNTSVSNGTYNEAGLKIAYAKYPCGGNNSLYGGSNLYSTSDPRRLTDSDGPFNNTFGDFLSYVREANSYWLNLITRPRVEIGN